MCKNHKIAKMQKMDFLRRGSFHGSAGMARDKLGSKYLHFYFPSFGLDRAFQNATLTWSGGSLDRLNEILTF